MNATAKTLTPYIGTKADPLTVRVYWDAQDAANKGWAYRIYDGACIFSAPVIESGAIDGRQTATAPSRARVLRSAGLRGGRHVRMTYDD